MVHYTLAELAAEAIEREQKKQEMEESEARNKQQEENRLLAWRATELAKLLPVETWAELGLSDLSQGIIQKVKIAPLFNELAGKFCFEFEGQIYEGSTKLLAQYGADEAGHPPINITLHIGKQTARLKRLKNEGKGSSESPSQTYIQYANPLILSELLASFVADQYVKQKREQEKRFEAAWERLGSSAITVTELEAFLEKADRFKLPSDQMAKLIERAQEQLPRLKALEAAQENDKALLESMNQAALDYEAEIADYQKAAKNWATKTTSQYWEAFSTYVATYERGPSETNGERCLKDELDERGYVDVIGSDGKIRKKKFYRIIMWELEKHTELPPVDRVAPGHSYIKADEYVANFPPMIDRDLLAEIESTKPQEPRSWVSRVAIYIPDFADRILAEQLQGLICDWYDDMTAIHEFRRRYLNWFCD